MLYDLGKLNLVKGFFGEIIAGLAFVAVAGGALFLVVTAILLAGKAIRFAWGW